MQKVLLVDLDSKIPNLVLMKLSAWHQRKGDNVSFNWYFGEYDKVYVSCIFRHNAPGALSDAAPRGKA